MPVPVNQFAPNDFCLYQMHGNEWEGCEDKWHRNYKGAPDNGLPWLSII
jgi:formylglycine-generating enzyme required for sulfatase activity